MEQRIGIERMEEAVNLFGSFDENIRLLEAEFQVQAVNRGGEIVVSGEPENVMLAVPVPRLAEQVPTMVTDWNSLQLWQCLTSLKGRHC